MENLHDAQMWSRRGEEIHCELCAHRCVLSAGQWGLCGVRVAEDGKLRTAVYGRAVALNDDPIEKKPLYHFFPGSRSLSVATVGCNFRCRFCQNWSISQVRKKRSTGTYVSPEHLVAAALDSNCRSIAFTYTEPTIYFEYALDTATLAAEQGIETVFVTNGFMTNEALERVAPVLSAANVDLKTFSDRTYREVTGGRLQPILDNLVRMKELGIWVEVTTLVVPGLNDSTEELASLAQFIADELGTGTPWHVSRFHPDHEMQDRGPTPAESVRGALDIGRQAGLRFVYAGNVPGDASALTRCPQCSSVLIDRVGHRHVVSKIVDNKCPHCGTRIPGRFSS